MEYTHRSTWRAAVVLTYATDSFTGNECRNGSQKVTAGPWNARLETDSAGRRGLQPQEYDTWEHGGGTVLAFRL